MANVLIYNLYWDLQPDTSPFIFGFEPMGCFSTIMG